LGSKDFAKERSRSLNFATALSVSSVPVQNAGSNTSHISIVDDKGNMVSFTTTIEAVFGSGMVVPGRGFVLNNELSDFDGEPKDATGRLKANAPGPGKRPRSSMTPVFVFREGRPVLIVGSPGGPKIIAAVLNVFLNYLDFKMEPEQAVMAPRVLNRDGPLELEPGLFHQEPVRRELETKGHTVRMVPEFGNVQAVFFDAGNGSRLTGVSDPRGAGEPAGD